MDKENTGRFTPNTKVYPEGPGWEQTPYGKGYDDGFKAAREDAQKEIASLKEQLKEAQKEMEFWTCDDKELKKNFDKLKEQLKEAQKKVDWEKGLSEDLGNKYTELEMQLAEERAKAEEVADRIFRERIYLEDNSVGMEETRLRMESWERKLRAGAKKKEKERVLPERWTEEMKEEYLAWEKANPEKGFLEFLREKVKKEKGDGK